MAESKERIIGSQERGILGSSESLYFDRNGLPPKLNGRLDHKFTMTFHDPQLFGIHLPIRIEHFGIERESRLLRPDDGFSCPRLRLKVLRDVNSAELRETS